MLTQHGFSVGIFCWSSIFLESSIPLSLTPDSVERHLDQTPCFFSRLFATVASRTTLAADSASAAVPVHFKLQMIADARRANVTSCMMPPQSLNLSHAAPSSKPQSSSSARSASSLSRKPDRQPGGFLERAQRFGSPPSPRREANRPSRDWPARARQSCKLPMCTV